MEHIIHILEFIYIQFIAVISYPIDPHSRIFVLYLCSSLAFSYFGYRIWD